LNRNRKDNGDSMNPNDKIVLGIDLGTTYCCVAVMNEFGKPEVVRNSEGEHTTPSVVWFENRKATVGAEAKAMAAIEPTEVVSFVKRHMGDPDYFFETSLGRMRPEEISSYILRKLVKDASESLGQDIRDVVITCPAYFSTREREATKKAGEIAGLNVVQILNEPTAAAISYGVLNSLEEKKNIFVYDLGGGTFDVTMIQVVKGQIEVICSGGDHHLGGKDWDDVMTRLIVDKFREESGIYDVDLLSIPEATQELMLLSEKIKIQLSQLATASSFFAFNGERYRITVTQEEFERETRPLLERTMQLTENMLKDAAAKGVNGFDELLLVGGSSKMPQVKKILQERFHKTPCLYDPDEAVAKGAAIIGANSVIRSMLEESVKQTSGNAEFSLDAVGMNGEEKYELAVEKAKKELRDEGFSLDAIETALMKVVNVSSMTFGTLCVNPSGKQSLFNLIYRNQSLPAEVVFNCGTLEDNQENVHFEIIESNEDEPPSDKALETEKFGIEYMPGERHVERWSDNLPLPPGMPAHEPLEIIFKMDKEGLLDATCRHVATGRSIHTVIHTGTVLSQKEEKEISERAKKMDIE